MSPQQNGQHCSVLTLCGGGGGRFHYSGRKEADIMGLSEEHLQIQC